MVPTPPAMGEPWLPKQGVFAGWTYCACISRGQWLWATRPNVWIPQLARADRQAGSLIAVVGYQLFGP